MPFDTDDFDKMKDCVANGDHKKLEGKWSENFMNLLDGLFKTTPEERLSIGQVLNEHIKENVLEFVNSKDFASEWMASRTTLLSMKDDNTKELKKVIMTEDEAKAELADYIKCVVI